MAKKIPFGKPIGQKIASDNSALTTSEFTKLLRGVLDGDERSREILRFMLDVMERGEADFDEDGFPGDDMYRDDVVDLAFMPDCMNTRELHIRIRLNDIDIKIWRELKVPSNMRLDSFAVVLLDTMGWSNEHMYQFRDGRTCYCMKEALDDVGFGTFVEEDMTRYSVGDLLKEKGKRIKFDYDFGDGWEHDVWLKGEREYGKGETKKVSCIKGQGACPPEDCGGVMGYMELIGLMKKKRLSREDRERLEWYDMLDDFDPDYFDGEYEEEMTEL